MAKRIKQGEVKAYTLYWVTPDHKNEEMDFTPGEKETAEQSGQELANNGCSAVRLAAVTINENQKFQHDFGIVKRFKHAIRVKSPVKIVKKAA